MQYVKEKATGTLVAADSAVQAEMLCLQGHRPLTAEELKKLDTDLVAPANTEIDHQAPGDQPGDAGGPPPKTGPGSGRGAWHEHAAAHNVAVDESASREEVIAALEAAGVATE